MKFSTLSLSAAILLVGSNYASATLGGQEEDMTAATPYSVAQNQTPEQGQDYILPREHAFYVIRNNVPLSDQPNAAQAGQYVAIPANATISILGSYNDPNYGTVLNVSLDTEPYSEIPNDFDISLNDFVTSRAQLVPPDVISQIEKMVDGESDEEAMAAEQEDQAAEEMGYMTAEANRGRGIRHAGRGGVRRGGMTYCLANVENRARSMGVCPYRIYASPQGWARTALPGFIEKCHMERYYGHDYQSLPIGSVCISHGTNHHMCPRGSHTPCGDAKIKIGAHTWYGWGTSREPGIGHVTGCATPRGAHIAAHEDKHASKHDEAKHEAHHSHSKPARHVVHHRVTHHRTAKAPHYAYPNDSTQNY